jgi:hypothetical protein
MAKTTISTPAGELVDGETYDLTLAHGNSKRRLKRAVAVATRPYGTDEVRWEAQSRERVLIDAGLPQLGDRPEWAIGFVPDNVLELEAR